jgi:hypothetical protein
MQDNPFQPQGVAVSATPSSFLIDFNRFSAFYAAAEFALFVGLPLDTSVTIIWSRLGLTTAPEVQAGFNAFLKCLRGWLDERGLPQAWIFCHEFGPTTGLHTHFAIHVPVMRARKLIDVKMMRQEFRRWARAWGPRQTGGPTPRAIRVRGPSVETPWLHWLLFHYLAKGYDRDAVVRTARNSSDGRDVLLGDLIAFAWRDPGPVGPAQRVGWSKTLGPAARAKGHHPDAILPLARSAPSLPPDFDLNAALTAPSLPGTWAALPGQAHHRPPPQLQPHDARPITLPPFRSRLEDGLIDVRVLYGAEFFERVTKLAAWPAAPEPVEPVALIYPDSEV